MKRTYFNFLLAVVASGALLVSCSDSENNTDPNDDDNNNQEEEGGDGSDTDKVSTFVLTATSKEANYIVTTDDLTQGTVTTVENGTETDTGTYWIYYSDEYLYRMVYNQGGAGVSSSYVLNADSKVEARANTYEVKRFTSYGLYGDYLITTSTGALDDSYAEASKGYIPKGFLINYIDVENETIGSNSEEIWAEDYFGDGEFVTFAGIVESDGKIFTAPIPMGMSHYGVVVYEDKIKYPNLIKTESGGQGSGSYTEGELQWTQYPDQAYIAIYPNKEFKNEDKKLIKTDKISYASGRSASQYYQMIWAADNGDIYVFSPGYAKRMADEVQRTTLPAGVMRIKSGTEEFDSDYYVNVEAQTNGISFLRTWHITDDYFLMLMYDDVLDPEASSAPGASSLAIFKGESGVVTPVSGMPENISNLGTMPYFADGIVYIPITVQDENPAVYMIDAATGVMTKGVSVEAERITSIGKMSFGK